MNIAHISKVAQAYIIVDVLGELLLTRSAYLKRLEDEAEKVASEILSGFSVSRVSCEQRLAELVKDLKLASVPSTEAGRLQVSASIIGHFRRIHGQRVELSDSRPVEVADVNQAAQVSKADEREVSGKEALEEGKRAYRDERYAEAQRAFKKALEERDALIVAEANLRLGISYFYGHIEKGEWEERDPVKAEEYLQKARFSGFVAIVAEAHLFIGKIYSGDVYGYKKHPLKSMWYLQEALKRGDASVIAAANLQIGINHFYGYTLEDRDDEVTAERYLLKAIESQDPLVRSQAHLLLGRMYLGLYPKPSERLRKAVAHIKKSFEGEYHIRYSQSLLNSFHNMAVRRVEKDHEIAKELLNRVLGRSVTTSTHGRLDEIYRFAKDEVVEDSDLALKYLEASVDESTPINAQALLLIGKASYDRGYRGTEVEGVSSKEYLVRALVGLGASAVMEASLYLGKIFFVGNQGVERDYDLAIGCLENVLEGEDENLALEAHYLLGKIYFDGGFGIEVDLDKAKGHLQIIIDRSGMPRSAVAHLLLGKIYLRGELSQEDLLKAIVCFEKALASRKTPIVEEAERDLCQVCELAYRSVRQDCLIALKLLKERVVSTKFVDAYRAVEEIYHLVAQDVKKDVSLAKKYLLAPADRVFPIHTQALVFLGRIYLNGDCGVEKNAARAKEFFERALVGEGAATAEVNLLLGQVYLRGGHGVEKDLPKAIELLQKAHVGGGAAITAEVNRLLEDICKLAQEKVQEDYKRAERHFKQALNRRLHASQYKRLAEIYKTAKQAVEKDVDLAKKILEAPADGEALILPQANLYLAEIYSSGLFNVKRDSSRASEYLKRALASGDASVKAKAHLQLGKIDKGDGFELGQENGQAERCLNQALVGKSTDDADEARPPQELMV